MVTNRRNPDIFPQVPTIRVNPGVSLNLLLKRYSIPLKVFGDTC